MSSRLVLGMNREMLAAGGQLPSHIVELPLRTHPKVEFRVLEREVKVTTPDLLAGVDVCLAGSALWNAETFRGVEQLCCVARWGVGYDNVDPKACTEADVALMTTRGALDYSVAESALSFMLALSHRMLEKDRHVRNHDWSQRLTTLGSELREKTIGIVGLGGIGLALLKLLNAFRPGKILVFDPFLKPERAQELGVSIASLNELLKASDIVTIHCPKTPETTNLIDAAQLALMKPTAYLVNTARGGIVNQKALYEALREKKIRGAGIDVFEEEPCRKDEPLLTLDNVILSPHANSLTVECFRDIGQFITDNVLKLMRGEPFEFVVNREVLTRPGFQKKVAALTKRVS
ncbi:MAG TPA: NAD(P)-dependent oxidoreductase [Planctomycetota bacterium]|nr:NAD(P)-dependent oxidoreductase [Planctomycetota bacterium]